MSDLNELIERQCDDMATGTQMREFLRDDDGSEPFLREMLRLNLEQFARRLGVADLLADKAELELRRNVRFQPSARAGETP